MRGSIAIWHDTFSSDADGYAPRAEVHINIWRNDKRQNDNFDLFDIGFRFKELRALRSLSISFPFEVSSGDVIDLFDVMHDTSTLSAIFNDTLSHGSMMDGGERFVAYHKESRRGQFFVWRCSNEDRRLSIVNEGNARGTIITIGDKLFDRIRPIVGDHYFRLRIKVPARINNGFVSSNDPKDSAFLSTISSSEIVEFRLNERRNFSRDVRDKLEAKDCDILDITALHYFLIRDMGVEMTRSHTNIKKMRRLEPEMWDRYLAGCSGFNPEKMIIYHWAAFAESTHSAVESFTALATFRAYYTGSLWFYGTVLVALGAMGSAAQGLGVELLRALPNWLCGSCGPLWTNALLLLILIGLLTWMVRCRRRKM